MGIEICTAHMKIPIRCEGNNFFFFLPMANPLPFFTHHCLGRQCLRFPIAPGTVIFFCLIRFYNAQRVIFQKPIFQKCMGKPQAGGARTYNSEVVKWRNVHAAELKKGSHRQNGSLNMNKINLSFSAFSRYGNAIYYQAKTNFVDGICDVVEQVYI